MQDTVRMMTRYMAWADQVMLNAVAQLPEAEIVKPRQTLFGNIVHTLNHILVIADIFKAHLEGRKHGYTARNTEMPPPFPVVHERITAIDQYFADMADHLSCDELKEIVHFEFVGGGSGAMSRFEILLHLVNHATYHRGFVSDLLYQVPFKPAASDLTVFLRDVWPGQKF